MNACDNSAKTMVCAECAVTKDVPVKDYYTMAEVTRLLHVSKEKIRRWEHLEGDPFPSIRLPGKTRGKLVQREYLRDWIMRNNEFVVEELSEKLLP